MASARDQQHDRDFHSVATSSKAITDELRKMNRTLTAINHNLVQMAKIKAVADAITEEEKPDAPS